MMENREATCCGRHRGHHGHEMMHGMGQRFDSEREHSFARKGFTGFSVDPTDLLALRSAQRHLEVKKADIEDRIADLDRKIKAHPDYLV